MDPAPAQTPQRRFVWPPRRPPVEVPVSREPAPAPTAHIASPSPSPAPSPPPAHTWRGVLLEIERVWFGLTTPPLHDRIAAAGWTPDPPDRYCGRCGSTVGPHEAGPDGCPACRRRRLPWERMVRLGEYTGLLRDVVQEVKFSRWRRLGDEIGAILGAGLVEALAREGISPSDALLVPVPASFRRRMSRGIDHSMVLARGVSRRSGIPVLPLLRRSHRPSQLSIPASQRGPNVAGSFGIRSKLDLGDRLVVVLDDVTTTRATLQAACRAIERGSKILGDQELRSKPRMWTAVVAVTPTERRKKPGGGAREGPDPGVQEAAEPALGSSGLKTG